MPPTTNHPPDEARPEPAAGLRRPGAGGRAAPAFRPLAWRILAIGTLLVTVGFVAGGLGDLRRRSRALGTSIGVVVATRDLPLGTRLGTADLRREVRPDRTAPSDAARTSDAVIGRTLAVPLLAGDLVRMRALAPGGLAGLVTLVPPGHRAIRIRPADGSRPPAGATVDLVAVADSAEGFTVGRAPLVVRDAIVLASRSEPDGTTAVTLLVPESAATAVVAAAVAGRIGLALAPPPAAEAADLPPPVG